MSILVTRRPMKAPIALWDPSYHAHSAHDQQSKANCSYLAPETKAEQYVPGSTHELRSY